MPNLSIRVAGTADAATLQPLIQRAYRGEASRGGWTHEADLLEGERISVRELQELIDDSKERILIAWRGGVPVGCVRVAKVGEALAYLGLLAVDPLLQADGIGKALIDAAEATACDTFECDRMEMTVIDSRAELIAYYERRGYALAGARAFPLVVDPPLHMVVLEKALV